MPVRLNSTGGGSVTLDVPATAGTFTVNLPAASGSVVTDAGAATVQFGAGSVSAPSITFSGDTNTGIYSPAADTIAFTEGGVEAMRIDSAGNVGIGTTTPGFRLDVRDAANTCFHIMANTSGARVGMSVDTPSASAGYVGTYSNNVLALGVNNAERMRIDTSGNVGIGTTVGGPRLRVSAGGVVSAPVLGNVTNYPVFISNTDIAYGLGIGTHFGTGHVWLQAQRADGNAVPYNITLNEAGGNVGIGTSSPGARLQVAGTSGSTQARMGTGSAGYLEVTAFDANPVYCVVGGTNHNAGVFGTQSNTPTIFFTNNTERARIDTSGNVAIGTTATNLGGVANRLNVEWDTTPGYMIALNDTRTDGFVGAGAMRFLRLSSQVGAITTSPSATFYITSSDYRLKENVVPLTGAAARVQALKPSRFNFIVEPDRVVDGFLAHEAAEVVPEAVTGEKDAVNEDGSIKPQGIDHSKLVPLLTAALQEALSRIETLEARLAAVEAR